MRRCAVQRRACRPRRSGCEGARRTMRNEAGAAGRHAARDVGARGASAQVWRTLRNAERHSRPYRVGRSRGSTRARDLEQPDDPQDSSVPGEFPYTRGLHPTGYRGKAVDGAAVCRFRHARRDQPALQGAAGGWRNRAERGVRSADADGPGSRITSLSRGEVGKCGVSVASLADMETLFDGIDLGSITASMTINAPAPMIFAMYLVVAEKQGASWQNALGDDSERHPQGVHRPEGVHLSAAAVDAARH